MLRSSRAKAAPLEKLAIAIDDAIVVIMVKMLCGVRLLISVCDDTWKLILETSETSYEIDKLRSSHSSITSNEIQI